MVVVTEANVRHKTFVVTSRLIDANKPDGWTVLSAYPESNPTFPCIVIDPAEVNADLLTLNGSARVNGVTQRIDIYSLSRYGKKQNDAGKDNVYSTLLNNQVGLAGSNLFLVSIDDGGTDMFLHGDEKINYGSLSVRYQVR